MRPSSSTSTSVADGDPPFAPFAERQAQVAAVEPTPQRAAARRVGEAMRAVIERLVATKAPADVLEQAAEALEAVAAALDGYPRGRLYEGFSESSTAGDPTAFFDYSPIMGRANPLAPPLIMAVGDGGIVTGRARYGSAYEGPPGCVHGGHIAAGFDEVLGMAQSMSGSPGMTGTLTVRYRRPTPLHVDLDYEGRLVRRDGRKIFTEGRLLHAGTLTAEAEAVFISVDFSKLTALAERTVPMGAEEPPAGT